MICRLCLTSDHKKYFDIFENGEKPIAEIIKQHMSFVQCLPTDRLKTVCIDCWNEIENFHRFYFNIEKAQIDFQSFSLSSSLKAIYPPQATENDNEEMIYAALAFLREFDELTYITDKDFDLNIFYSDDLDQKDKVSEQKESAISSNDQQSVGYSDQQESLLKNVDAKATKPYHADLKDIKLLECGICGNPFEKFSRLNTHSVKVHKKKGHVVCCERKFYKAKLLCDHVSLHFNPGLFRCKVCLRSFKNQDSLTFHNSIHEPNDSKNIFKCSECDRKFAKKYLLTVHEKTHLKNIEGEFHCDMCESVFATKYKLSIHRQHVHLADKLVCHICPKTFKQRSSLMLHVQSKHEEIGKYKEQCPECLKWFLHPYMLRRHQRNKHKIHALP